MSQNPEFQSNLLKRVEQFVTQLEVALAPEDLGSEAGAHIQTCAEALYSMVEGKDPIFGHEHWHGLNRGTIGGPTELLLRLKDTHNNALSPYEFIMACYRNGLTTELDAILVLAALKQYSEYFRDHGEKQISINMSARFLEMRNQHLIEQILSALEVLRINERGGESIIFEIHESAGDVSIDPMILELFQKSGAKFAMDDVVMDGQDVYRFSGFNGFTDFVKIDHKFLEKSESDPEFFTGMINFIRGQAPGSIIVAEGVQSADQAKNLLDNFTHIHYVQGRHLPDRQTFAKQWNTIELKKADKGNPSE